MIIVLLLLFQSLCLYCQRLVLQVHDRWINPKNARLLQEVAETVGDRKAQQHLQQQELEQHKRQNRRRLLEPFVPLGAGANIETCRFCANSPQGYCRHHFHLQELQLQKQQRQPLWPSLPVDDRERIGQEYRQLRRIKRELKRTLHQQQQHHRHSQSSKWLNNNYFTVNNQQYPHSATETEDIAVTEEQQNILNESIPISSYIEEQEECDAEATDQFSTC